MKIYVVGIGAGNADGMTFKARNVLEKADVIVGYTVYAELVKKLFPEKEYFVSAMKQEAERCRKAVEMAADGRNVAVVCSGDAGVSDIAVRGLGDRRHRPLRQPRTPVVSLRTGGPAVGPRSGTAHSGRRHDFLTACPGRDGIFTAKVPSFLL